MIRIITLLLVLSFSFGLQAQKVETTLASQVQQLLDERDIQNIKTKYGRTMDAKDFENFATVFADTVTVDMRARGGELMSLPKQTVVGFYQKQLIDRKTQHFLTDMQIELKGDEAEVITNYYSIHMVGEDRTDSTGHSEETYIRTEDGWKIKAIKLVPYVSPAK